MWLVWWLVHRELLWEPFNAFQHYRFCLWSSLGSIWERFKMGLIAEHERKLSSFSFIYKFCWTFIDSFIFCWNNVVAFNFISHYIHFEAVYSNPVNTNNSLKTSMCFQGNLSRGDNRCCPSFKMQSDACLNCWNKLQFSRIVIFLRQRNKRVLIWEHKTRRFLHLSEETAEDEMRKFQEEL